ncbi:hypothetical protein ACJBQY_10380, partial [Streptococcus suis]
MDQDNKNEENRIDEQYLMSIMAGSPQKEFSVQNADLQKEKAVTKNKLKTKKPSDMSYMEQFLTHHTMTKRGDKSIYIR